MFLSVAQTSSIRNLSEMQIHARPTESEILGMGPNILGFNKASRWFWCSLMLRPSLLIYQLLCMSENFILKVFSKKSWFHWLLAIWLWGNLSSLHICIWKWENNFSYNHHWVIEGFQYIMHVTGEEINKWGLWGSYIVVSFRHKGILAPMTYTWL